MSKSVAVRSMTQDEQAGLIDAVTVLCGFVAHLARQKEQDFMYGALNQYAHRLAGVRAEMEGDAMRSEAMYDSLRAIEEGVCSICPCPDCSPWLFPEQGDD